jgi:hypothetical protein
MVFHVVFPYRRFLAILYASLGHICNTALFTLSGRDSRIPPAYVGVQPPYLQSACRLGSVYGSRKSKYVRGTGVISFVIITCCTYDDMVTTDCDGTAKAIPTRAVRGG